MAWCYAQNQPPSYCDTQWIPLIATLLLQHIFQDLITEPERNRAMSALSKLITMLGIPWWFMWEVSWPSKAEDGHFLKSHFQKVSLWRWYCAYELEEQEQGVTKSSKLKQKAAGGYITCPRSSQEAEAGLQPSSARIQNLHILLLSHKAASVRYQKIKRASQLETMGS